MPVSKYPSRFLYVYYAGMIVALVYLERYSLDPGAIDSADGLAGMLKFAQDCAGRVVWKEAL